MTNDGNCVFPFGYAYNTHTYIQAEYLSYSQISLKPFPLEEMTWLQVIVRWIFFILEFYNVTPLSSFLPNLQWWQGTMITITL